MTKLRSQETSSVSFICLVAIPLEVGRKVWLQKLEFYGSKNCSFWLSRMGIPGSIHGQIVREGAFSNREQRKGRLIGLVKQ